MIVIIRHEFDLGRPVSTSSNKVLVGVKPATRPKESNITFKPQFKEKERQI
jgi:hypothetical protein